VNSVVLHAAVSRSACWAVVAVPFDSLPPPNFNLWANDAAPADILPSGIVATFVANKLYLPATTSAHACKLQTPLTLARIAPQFRVALLSLAPANTA